jgi:hypothetical protein
LEFSGANSDFSFKIVDSNFDNRVDLVTLSGKETFSFLRHDFDSEYSVKEVQLFDIADKLLKFPNQEESNSYLALIKKRFMVKEVKTSGEYSLDNFFSEKFKTQNNIEDLIVENYNLYSRLIKEAKRVNPNQTFQDLIDNCTLADKLNFLLLFLEYDKNLKRLGYKLEQMPSITEDYIEINFSNILRKEKIPAFKIELDTSFEGTVDVNKIKKFLTNGENFMFQYDEQGNYFYGMFKYFKN